MRKCTHIKSRVEVTPEVELFQYTLNSRRKHIFCMAVNGTNVALPSLLESHKPKQHLLVLQLLFFYSVCGLPLIQGILLTSAVLYASALCHDIFVHLSSRICDGNLQCTKFLSFLVSGKRCQNVILSSSI